MFILFLLDGGCTVAKELPLTFRHLCCWGLHLFVAPGDGSRTKNLPAGRQAKVENIFCCSIAIVKPGQKAEQRTGR